MRGSEREAGASHKTSGSAKYAHYNVRQGEQIGEQIARRGRLARLQERRQSEPRWIHAGCEQPHTGGGEGRRVALEKGVPRRHVRRQIEKEGQIAAGEAIECGCVGALAGRLRLGTGNERQCRKCNDCSRLHL